MTKQTKNQFKFNSEILEIERLILLIYLLTPVGSLISAYFVWNAVL